MEFYTGNKLIEQLFADFFGLDTSFIHMCFHEFKGAYNQKLSLPHEGFITEQKQSWKISFQEEQTLNNWENSTLIGIDLPLFFKCADPEAQTVMLVALDPLRKRKDFPDFKHQDVIIGTPFALHSSFYTEKKGRTKVYFDPIKHIVNKNYHLYVTDKYKVWMNDYQKGKEDVKYNLEQEDAIFEKLFLKELEIVKPHKIICFGTSSDGAYQFCKDILRDNDLESELLPGLLHPSGGNRNWNEMEFRPTVENKIEYLKTEINKHL